MTTLHNATPAASLDGPVKGPARPHWIDDWEPEDPAFWAAGGAGVAKRNLTFSILSEHLTSSPP